MYGISKTYEEFYLAGKTAYFEGRSKDACPYGKEAMKQRSFWLAGYMDAEIETVGLEHFRRE